MTKTNPIAAARREPMTWFVALSLAAFLILLPRFTDSAKTPYVLLCLTALGYLMLNWRDLADTGPEERFFFACVLANFGWITFCFYVNGEPGRGDSLLWGRHFYTLFIIPLFFLFRRTRITHPVILLILVSSTTLAFVDIMIDLATAVDHREQGMNPNAFGPLQLCLTFVLAFYFYYQRERWLKWFALAGLLMGLANVFLSLSKNTWITLFMLVTLSIIYLFRARPLWQRFCAVFFLLSVAIASYNIPVVKDRIDIGIDSVTSYFASDDSNDLSRHGTFGIRAELWKTGWYIFLENPLTGVGVGGFKLETRANLERYGVNPVVHRFKYVHNQYLAALSTRGLPGLVLFLPLLGLPIYLAWKTNRLDEPVARYSVIFICLVYLIGCFAEDHFEGKSAIMFTSIMLAMFLARCSPSTRSLEPDPDAN